MHTPVSSSRVNPEHRVFQHSFKPTPEGLHQREHAFTLSYLQGKAGTVSPPLCKTLPLTSRLSASCVLSKQISLWGVPIFLWPVCFRRKVNNKEGWITLVKMGWLKWSKQHEFFHDTLYTAESFRTSQSERPKLTWNSLSTICGMSSLPPL